MNLEKWILHCWSGARTAFYFFVSKERSQDGQIHPFHSFDLLAGQLRNCLFSYFPNNETLDQLFHIWSKLFFLGKRHDFKLREESLKIRLFENNTVVISAKLDVAVHARTWIWKGVNFGFLGCMKITSCGGQDVTYKGKIDMKVSFEVLWNEEKKRIGVTIRPVDTQLTDVYVTGCRPPWYLWWVSQKAFSKLCDNFQAVHSVGEALPEFKKQFYGNQHTKENNWCTCSVL